VSSIVEPPFRSTLELIDWTSSPTVPSWIDANGARREAMARRNKASLFKRQREQKKAEKAAHKREARAQRETPEGASGTPVASAEDLAGYGLSQDDPRSNDRG
jgi:hypothetical protein